MTHATPENQPGQPFPGEGQPPVDARSQEERAADDSVSALFRNSGLALSNGHAPAIQGADARAKAAEEAAIAAIFQSADCLLTAPGPDFRRMAVKAREIARDRGELGPEEELEGERVRSDLEQLPDLEVRCWNVSQTASLPMETATSSSRASGSYIKANSSSKRLTTAPAQPVIEPVAAAEPVVDTALAPVAEGLTAVDAANIRENNWAEFKRRYHREHRTRIFEMAAAGALGAAACFLVIWVAGSLNSAARPNTATAERPAAKNNGVANGDKNFNHADKVSGNPTAARAREGAETNADSEVVPMIDMGFGGEQSDWMRKNTEFVGLPVPRDVQDVGNTKIVIPKREFDPNPSRHLPVAFDQDARPGDNAAPEIFAERGLGLRIIRLNPRSDFAQSALGVNDWITRVIKPDGTTIELSQGNEKSISAWQGFLATQRAGDSFDVEYQRGPLIRRTSILLTNAK